jgi:hypothetical protein
MTAKTLAYQASACLLFVAVLVKVDGILSVVHAQGTATSAIRRDKRN